MSRRPLSPITWLRRRARALRHVAWRDDTIRRLRDENARLAAQLAADTPSFRQHVFAARRVNAHMAPYNHPDRGNLIARKLKSYSFAQSHGVRIPEVFGIWDAPEDIDWDALPDRVVIKTNTGSTGRGVFPLRRDDGRWYVVTQNEPIAPEDVVGRLRQLRTERRVGRQCFAEELLGGGAGNALPLEVRVSAFYGEVSHVLLRQVREHGSSRTAKSRRIGVDGVALGDDDQADELPVPTCLDELVDVARRLSSCIPHPFVRVDLYDIGGDVVFGELTPRPGSPGALGPELDERLGRMWEEAEARVLNDVIDGGDYRLKFGPGPRELQVGDGAFVPERGWSDA